MKRVELQLDFSHERVQHRCVLAVETAVRKTKPVALSSPEPISQSAAAEFVWITAILIAIF
jgi:hypothetical protein